MNSRGVEIPSWGVQPRPLWWLHHTHVMLSLMAKPCNKKKEKEDSHSPTVLPGFGDVAWVSTLSDQLAHPAVSVGGEQGAGFDKQPKAVIKSVAFLWAILCKEAMAQGIVAHNIFHLHIQNKGQPSAFMRMRRDYSNDTEQPRHPLELRVCKQNPKQDHSAHKVADAPLLSHLLKGLHRSPVVQEAL